MQPGIKIPMVTLICLTVMRTDKDVEKKKGNQKSFSSHCDVAVSYILKFDSAAPVKCKTSRDRKQKHTTTTHTLTAFPDI